MTTLPRIVVLDDWEQAFERLADWSALRARAQVALHAAPLAGAALQDAIHDADVLVLMRDRTRVDDALLDRMPRLRHVIHTGTRNRALDADALARAASRSGRRRGGRRRPARASTPGP